MNFLDAFKKLSADTCADYIYFESEGFRYVLYCTGDSFKIGFKRSDGTIAETRSYDFDIQERDWQVEYKIPTLDDCAHCGGDAEIKDGHAKDYFVIKCLENNCGIQTKESKDKHELCRIWNGRDHDHNDY